MMETVINIPEWAFIIACVYMSVGIIYRIIKIVKLIQPDELHRQLAELENPIHKKSWLTKLKNIKWPRWKFKRPKWMDRTGMPDDRNAREMYNDGIKDAILTTTPRECKSCHGLVKILIDGLCVGCSRE